MSVAARSHALYVLTSARRLGRFGVDGPSIDPKATVEELEREFNGGEPAPSWTPPPRSSIELPDLSAAFGGASRPEPTDEPTEED